MAPRRRTRNVEMNEGVVDPAPHYQSGNRTEDAQAQSTALAADTDQPVPPNVNIEQLSQILTNTIERAISAQTANISAQTANVVNDVLNYVLEERRRHDEECRKERAAAEEEHRKERAKIQEELRKERAEMYARFERIFQMQKELSDALLSQMKPPQSDQRT